MSIGTLGWWVVIAVGIGVVCSLLRPIAQLVAANRRARSDRLDLALWASGEELWEIDVASEWRVRFGKIPDLDREDVGSDGELAAFRATVHPDDLPELVRAYENLASGQVSHAEVTFRVQLKSGGWAWLNSRGRVGSTDASGRVTRIVGSTRDVSTLKANEERLSFALRAAGEELWEVDRLRDEIRRENPLAAVEYGTGDYRMTRAEFGALLHPEDIDHVTQAFFAAWSGQTAEFSVVFRMRGRLGRYIWVHSQGLAVDLDENGRPRRMLGTSREITAIKVNEERLRLALWGSRAELWDVDMDSGAFVRENCYAHLDWGREVVPFAKLLNVVHEEDRETLRRAITDHAKGEREAFEAQFRIRDVQGAWCWLLARGRVTERNAEGRALRLLGMVHDIDAMKQVEEELRRLNEELEARVARRTQDLSKAIADQTSALADLRLAKDQLVESEKLAALGSLVAGVAHEINTPLGIAVTATSHLGDLYAETPLGETANAESARRCIDLIQRNLGRADNLVKSFKQVAVDQTSEIPRRIVLAEYLAEIIAALQPRLRHTSHQVRIQCPPSLVLTTYAGAIYQIVTNLLVNSLIHGFEDMESGIIAIDARREGDDVVVAYTDNGRGMAAAVRSKVFDPFFTTRRGTGGTGLGMHIAYNLATQVLRGSIQCESVLGQGVLFVVRIPSSLPTND